MGNTSKKLAAKCTLLNKEEQKNIAATFRAASRNSEKIREDDLIVSGKLDAISLEKFWGPQIDPRLAQYLSNYLFGFGANKVQTVDFNRFAELYVYNVRGTVDERLTATYNSLAYSDGVELPYQLIKEYCESLASTYIKMLKSSSLPRNALWLQKGFRGSPSNVQCLGEAVAATLWKDDCPKQTVTHTEVTKWLQSNIILHQLSELVFSSLYGIATRPSDEESKQKLSLLPYPEGLESMPDYPAITDVSHVAWLNAQLPPELQHKWRFLFSSHIHGESFSTMAGRIIDQGPSVLIIQDTNHHIFGGFAADSWAISANWTGNDTSFLFTLAPKMRAYTATSYNDHYQYMNHHTKTLPNGIIMGGQFEFAGIYINAEPFGEGSSAESCSTYRGYRRLSKEGAFRIRAVEVWAVGDKPLSDKEQEERDTSILDANPEAKAILDMAGKTRHSDGIREPPPL